MTGWDMDTLTLLSIVNVMLCEPAGQLALKLKESLAAVAGELGQTVHTPGQTIVTVGAPSEQESVTVIG